MVKTAETPQIIFICGVGRSGTSLVQSMLASHSQVAILPETAVLRRYVSRRTLAAQFNRGGADCVLQFLKDDVRCKGLPVDLGATLAPFRSGQQRFSDIAWYLEVLRLFGDRFRARYVGDKDPRLIEFLPFLASHFGQANIIHVVRDPRDVLASKKEAKWSRGRWWLAHTFANRVQFRIGHRNGPKLFPASYCELIYEQLLRSPQEVLGGICEQLKLEYEPSMMDFADTARRLVRADETSWKQETMGPLLQQNSGKWRNALTPFEVATSEAACHDTLQVAGYDKSDSIHQLRVLQKLAVRMSGLLWPVFDFGHRLYRGWTVWR